MAKKAKGIAPSYFQQLLPEEKKRYQEKIRIISGIDPFTLSLASARHGQSNNPAALPCPLPPIDSTDLLINIWCYKRAYPSSYHTFINLMSTG